MQKRLIRTLTVLISFLNQSENSMAQEEAFLTFQSAITFAQQNNSKLIAAHSKIIAAKCRCWTTWWLADLALSKFWRIAILRSLN